MNIQRHTCLKNHHTFGCPVQSQFFTELTDTRQLQSLLQHPDYDPDNIMILGSGSNILFCQDYYGLTVKNKIKGIRITQQNKDNVWVTVGAGENWHRFVCYCVENQFYGAENLSFIPGTVGAAPIQNIGAYGTQLEDIFDHLKATHLYTGEEHQFNRSECQFDYRNSVFKQALKKQFCITEVTFKLALQPQYNISYPALESYLEQHQIKLTLQNIHQAVINIRSSKLPCPSELPNAGSFFKNPYIHPNLLNQLKERFPLIPSYPINNTQIKVPAAWLIEQCELKGKRFGAVGVHKQHALVLINYDRGSGKDIHLLAQHITQCVYKKFGIQLECEVNIL